MNDESKKEIITNSLWEFSSKIIEKVGSIIFTIILARFLLPEGFGIYSLTLTISLIFISAIDYAVDSTSIRYVSDALAKNNPKLAASYFRYLLKIKLKFAFVLSITLILLAFPLSNYMLKKPYLFVPLFISGFYIFVSSISNTYESLFYSTKKVGGKFFKSILQQISRILISLIVFFTTARTYYVIGIFFGMILTSFLVITFIIIYIKKNANFLFEENDKEIDKKRVHKFLKYLLIGGTSGLLFMYVDTLLLGYFLADIKYIGFYNSAISLVWGLGGFLSFATVLLPIFTQIKKKNMDESLNKIIRFSFIMTIPATFGVFVLSKYIILTIYGREYLEAAVVLSILSFLIIESVNSSVIGTVFSAKEKPKDYIKIVIFSFFMNVILNFILIKYMLLISEKYAMIGAAIATLISRYTSFFLLITALRKKLGLKIRSITWIKPLISSLIMVGSLLFINKFVIKDMNFITGLIEIVFGIFVYFFSIILTKGLDKKDWILFKNIFK